MMAHEPLYDVIVVGGGPAGSTAALDLARGGWRVLLLEKDRLPRVKTCAGGLPRKSLAALGVDTSEVHEAHIQRALVTYRARQPIEMTFDRPLGSTVMRANFDYKLAQAAVGAGVTLVEKSRVRQVSQTEYEVSVTTDRQVYRGRYLIGADSVNSTVAPALGLMPNRRAAIAFEAELPVSPENLARYRDTLVFDFGGVPYGYAWIFAKSDHLSVGAAVFHDQGDKRIRQHVIDYAVRAGLLAPGQPLDCPCKGHPIPLGDGARTLHAGRTLLAGDAAGLADPFLGEGIYYAIRSGQLAAQALHQALSPPPQHWGDGGAASPLALYTETVNREMIADFAYARRFATWCYRLPRVAHWMFATRPRLRAALARTLEGESTWEELWHDGLRTLLPFLPASATMPPAPLSLQKT
jgi:geranylgeranyl reductase family protein